MRSSAIAAARAASAKNARDTVVLDVADIIGITDYFVITHGTSARQVKAIAEEVERKLKEVGLAPAQTEGLSDASWVLMDYGGIFVHVFAEETRGYYALERLWGDADPVEWEETAAAVS
ncbi:MAG: ribosome silencing factor [Acidimicrobiia bacterium]